MITCSIYENSLMYKNSDELWNLVGNMEPDHAISLHAGWEYNEKEKLRMLRQLMEHGSVQITRKHYYDFDRAGFTAATFNLTMNEETR